MSILVVPSWKVTVPVGVAPPGTIVVRVAVKVTFWPSRLGLTEVRAIVVPPTDWIVVEVLDLKFASPLYVALMKWLPLVRAEVDKLAEPPAPNETVTRSIVPSLNVTVPVGVPEPGSTTATDAVKVTVCPKRLGLVGDSIVVVLSRTCWFRVAVLAMKFASPLYVAVMEWLPLVRAAVEMVAAPAVNGTASRTVVPSLKVTVPVGIPAPGATGATTAVKLRLWPGRLGFAPEIMLVLLTAWLTT
jgi:aromatic ring-cleaving dioxygenase